jgi:hypothetical protein
LGKQIKTAANSVLLQLAVTSMKIEAGCAKLKLSALIKLLCRLTVKCSEIATAATHKTLAASLWKIKNIIVCKKYSKIHDLYYHLCTSLC